MVHALHEARRVLKTGGLLIDLRPAAVHCRVGVMHAGRYQLLGIMREGFDHDYAADRAVAEVVRQGLFRVDRRVRFECNRTMDRLAEFRAWLGDFFSMDKLPSHEWLFQRVDRAFGVGSGRMKIIVTGPLDLRMLKKQ